jgi:hypothetical protein
MTHAIGKKCVASLLVVLVGTAILVPVSQARVATSGSGQPTHTRWTPIIDVAAIKARRHFDGFHRTGQAGVSPPDGFVRPQGPLGRVPRTPVQVPATAVKQTGTAGVDWAPLAASAIVVGLVAVALVVGGKMVRTRRRLATP